MDCASFLIHSYGRLYNRRYIPSFLLTPLRFIIRRIANKVIPWYYIKNRVERDLMEDIAGNIVVSLTSFPKRINNVWIVIESLIRQTIKPNKIILYLSKNQFPSEESLPSTLTSRLSNVFEIIFVEGDIRSHKKYYYSFKKYPSEYVVTVDDDIIYPPDMIESLLKAINANPNSVVGRYCLTMKYDGNGQLLPYNSWETDYDINSENAFLGTGGGTLFEPQKLYEDTLKLNLAINLSPLADDVWLNAMIRLSGQQIRIISKELLLPIITKSDQRLTQINVYENKNDEQISMVTQYYKDKIGVNPFEKR